MLIVFPVDEEGESQACIAWGKVLGAQNNESVSPITKSDWPNGSTNYKFTMNVSTKKTVGEDGKEQRQFKWAHVEAWVRPYDYRDDKISDVLKLLRTGDKVLVFGRYKTYTYRDKKGVEQTGQTITTDVIIPAEWLYDILLALFAQVVSQNPVLKKIDVKQAPPKEKKISGKAPQITHPVTIEDDEGWFE